MFIFAIALVLGKRGLPGGEIKIKDNLYTNKKKHIHPSVSVECRDKLWAGSQGKGDMRICQPVKTKRL